MASGSGPFCDPLHLIFCPLLQAGPWSTAKPGWPFLKPRPGQTCLLGRHFVTNPQTIGVYNYEQEFKQASKRFPKERHDSRNSAFQGRPQQLAGPGIRTWGHPLFFFLNSFLFFSRKKRRLAGVAYHQWYLQEEEKKKIGGDENKRENMPSPSMKEANDQAVRGRQDEKIERQNESNRKEGRRKEQ